MGKVLICFTLFILLGTLLALPWAFSNRIYSGIFKLDFFIIWLSGIFCWLSVLIYWHIKVKRLGLIALVGCIYIAVAIFFQALFDENSIAVFMTVISLIGIALFLYCIKDLKYFKVVFGTMVICFIVQLVIVIKQGFQTDWQSLALTGQFTNSGILGNYFAALSPVFIAALLYARGNIIGPLRLALIIGIILIVLLLLISIARAAILGALAGCIVVALRWLKFKRKQIRILISIFLVIMSGLVAVLYQVKPASANGRLTIYEVSLEIFKKHPFFGVGPNRFPAEYNNYQSGFFRAEDRSIEKQLLAENILEAFNSTLQLLSEYGILGFLIVAFFIVEFLRQLKMDNIRAPVVWLREGCLAGVISIFVCSLFSNPMHVTPILMVLAFQLSIIIPGKACFASNGRMPSFPIVVWAASALCISIFILHLLKAQILWNKAAELAKIDDYVNAKPLYEPAYETLKFNGDYLFNFGAEASIASDYHTSLKLLERSRRYHASSYQYVHLGNTYSALNMFGHAEESYLHSIYIAPSHVYPKYQLVQLYKKMNRTDLVELWVTQTLNFPLKIKSEVAIQLLNELRTGQRD